MPSSEYAVNIVVKTTDQTSGPAKEAAKSIGFLDGVMMKLGGRALDLAKQIPQAAIELTKLGAAAERQENALNNLAAASGTSGTEIINAIRSASDFTIDRMTAMQAANRAMVMDVAQSPQEFERLTKVAVALGRAMGQDAAKSIDDFVTASARQSQMIADNLGLTVTVGQATERYAASLGITVDQLTDAQKKQAFLNMMLEEGEKKMLSLGDATLDNAGKIEQATGLWKTFTSTVGKGFSEAVLGSTGDLGKLNQFLDEHESVLSKAVSMGLRFTAGQMTASEVLAEVQKAAQDTSVSVTVAAEAANSAVRNYTAMAKAVEDAERASRGFSYVSDEVKASLQGQVTSQGMLEHTILQTAEAIRMDGIGSQFELENTILGTTEALKEEAKAMDAFVFGMDQSAQLDMSMRFTGTLDSMKQSAEQFATDRESLDAQHQARLAEIAQKGQSKAIQINVEAEQKKLGELQYRMEQAQLKVEEMSGKEADSTRIGKEHTLSEAQAAYAEQQKLLEDYAAGRLVTAGQNTDAMIAEEQRQYEESVRLMDLQMEKQAQVQRQALGQMMLQAFDSWEEQKDLPPEMTGEVTKMRTAIAEEYGLVSAGSTDLVTDMIGELDDWATGAGASTDDVVRYMGNVIDASGNVQTELLELTAKDWVIRVRYELMPPEQLDETDVPRPNAGCAPGMVYDPITKRCVKKQQPSNAEGIFAPTVSGIGAPAMVNAPITSTETYNETYNILDPRALAVLQENQRRQRRASLSRYM